MDLAAAAVLSLTGPGTYWVAGGDQSQTAFTLWLAAALQSSASIVHIFLRLRQRRLPSMPSQGRRWAMAMPSLVHHVLNVVIVIFLVWHGWAHALLVLAMALTLAEGIQAAACPPVGKMPVQVGVRQLIVSTIYFLLAAVAFSLS
jgi:hypothetical protein